ncbi:oligosaccharide repeat unit polymerase [Cytobacillus firmus]|uniref:O-antigen polymerase n=1 Tax=Cytobacillus firmus TaxID=1399 RepID=UPI0021CA0BA6|nr:O-antigen polymerase [Cytobacillus firmus]MCU1807116.1 oligosaccharide repeat unit polymerase [Cytobacillus firmus]
MKHLMKKIILIYIYILLGTYFIYGYNWNMLDPMINNSFVVLIISYFFIVGLFLILCFTMKCDIFEPFIFCSVIMIMLFIITPIINIINNDLLVFGVNLMNQSVKGTLIFDISYIAFSFGYFLVSNKYRDQNKIHTQVKTLVLKNRNKVASISVLMWLSCFLISIIYLLSSGKSLIYILSAGLLGQVGSLSTNVSFLSMFSYSMLTFWMLVFVYSKSKSIKVILWLLTLNIYFLQGFRFIIVILILAPILYYYISKGKRPSIRSWILLFFSLSLMVGVVGFVRTGIRSGQNIEWSSWSLFNILETLNQNFGIYKSYYGVLEAIPSLMDYTKGQQILYTFEMLIPRFLWPSKPLPLQSTIVSIGINESAAKSGYAFPNLGEYYGEFGAIGCVVIMLLLGGAAAKSKSLYIASVRKETSIIMYSILLPAMMQLIIRGYTPSNFYLIVFLLSPILITRLRYEDKGYS